MSMCLGDLNYFVNKLYKQVSDEATRYFDYPTYVSRISRRLDRNLIDSKRQKNQHLDDYEAAQTAYLQKLCKLEDAGGEMSEADTMRLAELERDAIRHLVNAREEDATITAAEYMMQYSFSPKSKLREQMAESSMKKEMLRSSGMNETQRNEISSTMTEFENMISDSNLSESDLKNTLGRLTTTFAKNAKANTVTQQRSQFYADMAKRASAMNMSKAISIMQQKKNEVDTVREQPAPLAMCPDRDAVPPPA